MESGHLLPPSREPELKPRAVEYRGNLAETDFLRPEPVLWDYWRTLRKRKWIIISSTVIIWALVILVSLRMTPLYEAKARIAIFHENSEPLGIKEVQPASYEDSDYTVDLETQVKILQSEVLAALVANELQPREATGAIQQKDANAQDGANANSALMNEVRGGLKVAVVPRTRIVELTYTGPDPNLAEKIVNTLTKVYVEQNYKTKFESTMETSDWLSKQLADLELKVQVSEEKLVRYQQEQGIVGLDEKQNIITARLDELNKELTTAEADRMQREATYRLAQSGSPEFVYHSEKDDQLNKLRAQESDLKTQYAQVTTQFGPGYPRVAEINNQLKQVELSIKAEIQNIGSRIRNEYVAATKREAMLSSALEAQKKEDNQLNERAIQYSQLKRDAQSNRQLYDSLLQRLKEATISAGLKSGNIRVIDPAHAPTSPSSPNIPRNIALGLLVGLGAGIGFAFVLEAVDSTVRTVEEVESVSALPALGVIPLSQTATSGLNGNSKLSLASNGNGSLGLVTHNRPSSEVAESFRTLRTSILLSSSGAPPKVIVVTSALPKEGKTTTSLNTAIVLAQKGARVLLVDADLRRPGIHRAFGLKPHCGLSSLLSGGAKSEDAIIPCEYLSTLQILPSGPTPPHPAELLASDVMRRYLAEWRKEFDHIVIDTPPIITVTDGVVLAVEADTVILVIRSGSTPKAALRRAREMLYRVNASVMGVVLNGIDLRSPDHYYYYYYGSKESGHYYQDAAAKASNS